MVLLTASVCTKAGKAIISRQFVEMTKARIEGLLAAFPKLMGTGKQHTFVETESVRYVYQPLEKLYMLLITTKASNILEDLETLRLFSKVIPEYCKNMEESEILENSFNLIFAFDEIVALGYRESVNLAQIRTFVEMDSHEEKVFQAVRQTQEREAKNKMKEKAKELQRARQDAAKKGLRAPGFGSVGYSSVHSSYSSTNAVISESIVQPEPKISHPSNKTLNSSKAMRLGQKGKDVDSFVDQLKSEGENVLSPSKQISVANIISTQNEITEPIHLHIEEKINLTAKRDGGVQNLEIHGMVTLNITEEKFDRIKIHVDNKDDKGIQLQTHPNIDKELFKRDQVIALKNPAKPFPLSTDVGVLKWRFQSQDENFMPLSINCWPSENGQGGCDVNIEYELEQEKMELNNVTISIPLASGVGSPIVSDCEGEYHYDSRKNILEWNLDVIDSNNKSGSMEFSVGGHPSDFFPVNVTFLSKKSYCDLRISDVSMVSDGSSANFSSDTVLSVDKYEII